MSIYKNYTPDQVDELLSHYLIDSWSFSKVSNFSRNEKDFEMKYLYGMYGRESASGVAGKAYHAALGLYFSNKQAGIITDIVELEQEAFSFIDSTPADNWKIQKTTPSIEDCKSTASKTSVQLIKNFFSEIGIYEEETKEVIGVELKIKTWITVNGADIPMPVNLVIDEVIITNDDKRVIIDHKSKRAFTDESEIKFSIGKQAITYVLGYEAETGQTIDEVWFIENKSSMNKDKSAQLICSKVVMDLGTRRLYEALLYEPLKRMIEAVGDPDYVYMINDNDTLCEKAELYEFWAKTMLAEIEDFNIPENKKPLISARLRKIRDASLSSVSPNVIKNFKKFASDFIPYDLSNKDMTNQEKIEHILRTFSIPSKVQHVFGGYSSSSYLLEVSAGVQISSIQRYKLDIANALNVSNVRIYKDLFVYEGKSYVVVESGKKNLETLLWDKTKLVGNKIPLGVDNFQQTIVWDLDNNSTPHMLVCGATGSGKSVFIRSIIEYALLDGVKSIYIFDPKHEFNEYSGRGCTVLNDIDDIEIQMMMLIEDMEKRVKSHTSEKTLIVFDEFADAVSNSRKGNDLKSYGLEIDGFYKNGSPKMKRVLKNTDKSLEENLRVLLQKGRSSGFRIIAATQRASTKVITGDAKVNFPVQVCFRVPKDVDSMVVIDETGAESLNGRGDGLIKSPEYLNVVRFQSFYKG